MYWKICLGLFSEHQYSNHSVQDICSYEDYLPDRPEELYLSFMEYFEPDEDSFEFI